ncbi:hypothetical protein J3Q64DRAFT_1703383 [Phycomyces blakesleeanus]|uniref:Uncharacterized protein n=2 Tax=Phycomyces blakesleeanus TaxID=4837 RepID=A0A167L9G3_PHYB8|nr:hypothetical protein PHYBLDRAFT_171919 [Phycomyces blakesleeanus NRRL 1555(-)]OAD69897.1 hypothetical protein PHYBLDRAFT_171919 [Phycomyces blakesleeanus NRRL 1555(-)]|eukprot:XP_018287937.1 hypothetical protein PHYBLDRAFT_171919 [Phycomyces blakesleeanus NRRL 1555(-)]
MSDLEDKEFVSRRRSSSASLTASPSSSYKMSIDSDDAKSTSSLPKYPTSLYSRQNTAHSAQSFLSSATELASRRPPLSRSVSDQGLPWFDYAGSSSRNDHPMADPSPSCSARSRKQSSSHTKASLSIDTTEGRRDPERRSVQRRSSLMPRSKALARVLNQAEEDTHLSDLEMRREQETTNHMKEKDKSPAEGQCIKDTECIAPSLPPASWVRVRDVDQSPTMAPYQCSKLNPEVEMAHFQLENLPSTPVQQGFRSIKRKASEDRLYEPYSTASMKRRAVSPSVSVSPSPILTGISSPPAAYIQYGSSPTHSGGNAAARAQQKLVQLSTNTFNLQDASGGLSRMSLSE